MFSQIKKLGKHSGIYGLGTLSQKIIAFLLVPIYTRYLSTNEFGIFALILTIEGFLAIIFNMGTSSSLFKYYYLFNENEEEKKRLISTVFFFVLTIDLAILVNIVIFREFLASSLLTSSKYASLLVLSTISILTRTLLQLPLAVYRAKEKSIKFILFSGLNFVAVLLLNIYLVVWINLGILGIILSNLISTAILCLLLSLTMFLKNSTLSFSWTILKKVQSFGTPVMLGGIGLCVIALSDRFFLEHYSTPTEVGIYSLGDKIASAVFALLVSPFLIAWSPLAFSIADRMDAKEIYARILTYFVLIAGFATLGLSIFRIEIVSVIATTDYMLAVRIIGLLALSYVIYGAYFQLLVGMALTEKNRFVPFITSIAVIINVGLNFMLVPLYGMMGAAISTLAAYTAMSGLTYFVSRHFYPINYEFGRIFKILICGIGVYGISTIFGKNISLVNIIIKFVFMFSFLLLLQIMRFYTIDERRKVHDLLKNFKLKAYNR